MTATNITQAQIDAGLIETGFRLGAGQFSFSIPGADALWPTYAAGEEPFVGYAILNAAQAAAFRAAIALWDDLIAPDFIEIAEVGDARGELRAAFSGLVDAETAAYAYSGTPQATGGKAGDIWINPDMAGENYASGSFNFELLLHEIGHTLGLKHPFEAPELPAQFNNTKFTVLAYEEAPQSRNVSFAMNGNSIRSNIGFVVATTPMVLDIAAAQAIYGAETTTRSGDTEYRFSESDATRQSIYDAGGNDTIDLSNFTRGSAIDLNPGAYSSVGIWTRAEQAAFWIAQFPDFANFINQNLASSQLNTRIDNLGIAFSSVIENAIGGAAADVILGNAVANRLDGGGGSDTIDGGGGDDIVIGGAGNDTLTGGGGGDLFVFASAGQGSDRITDFEIASDRFDLSGGLFTGVSVDAGSTTLSYAGGTIVVANVVAASLSDWNGRVVGGVAAPPLLLLIDPADDRAAVPVSANITLVFSGAVARGSGTIILSRADGTLMEAFDVATSTRLSFTGTSLVIDPTRVLDAATGYVVSIASGAVSVGGVGYAGLTDFGFTTAAVANVASRFFLLVPTAGQAGVQGYGNVFGSIGGTQDVTVLDVPGRIVFDGSFNAGGDRIRLSGNAANYTVARSGATVEISDGDTVIAVPVGTGGADILFADGVRSLSLDASAGIVRLGSQGVSALATSITAPAAPAVATGAVDAASQALLLVNAGASAAALGNQRVFGTIGGSESVTVAPGARLNFDGSFNAGGDTILLPGAAASYTASRSGATLTLTSASETITLPVGPTAYTLRFADGDRAVVLDVAAATIRVGAQAIDAAPVALTPAAFTTASIDQDNDGSLATAFVVGAAAGNLRFNDDPGIAHNVRLTGFAAGDRIVLSGSASDYVFTAAGGDITISRVGSDGRLSSTVFAGVADPAIYVSSEASAELAAGYDFVTFAV